MPRVFIVVEYENFATAIAPGIKPYGRKTADMRAVALKKAATHWHQKILPDHFKSTNKQYKFQSRKPRYRQIKKELGQTGRARVGRRLITEDVRKGGVVDLVRKAPGAGKVTIERMVRGPSPISSGPTKATVIMRAPSYAARKPRDGKPDMRLEITQTLPYEREQLRQIMYHSMVRSLLEYQAAKVKRKVR